MYGGQENLRMIYLVRASLQVSEIEAKNFLVL